MELELSNGKKVVMREVTALEDLLCWQIIGKEAAKDDNQFGTGMLFRKVSVVLGIEKVDDKVCVPPTDLKEVMMFLGQFKKKDWNKIEDAYDKLNGDSEEDLGE